VLGVIVSRCTIKIAHQNTNIKPNVSFFSKKVVFQLKKKHLRPWCRREQAWKRKENPLGFIKEGESDCKQRLDWIFLKFQLNGIRFN